MTSAHEYDDTSVCLDGLDLSIENRASYDLIYSNMHYDQSVDGHSNYNDKKNLEKKINTTSSIRMGKRRKRYSLFSRKFLKLETFFYSAKK